MLSFVAGHFISCNGIEFSLFHLWRNILNITLKWQALLSYKYDGTDNVLKKYMCLFSAIPDCSEPLTITSNLDAWFLIVLFNISADWSASHWYSWFEWGFNTSQLANSLFYNHTFDLVLIRRTQAPQNSLSSIGLYHIPGYFSSQLVLNLRL